ncbi:MAG TPA: hypothetical protein VHX14_20820 [Thermoanaerobaculia bacterium]|jgi:hypothetical protein|nr:hypothetical protein [Thermoanaerobaculia bacterium]
MSGKSAVNQTSAAAAAGDQFATPEAIVETLRALREQIPEYVQLAPADAKSIQPVANVHPDFAQAAINAIGASPLVQAVAGRTPEALQQEVETAARWSKVEDELLAMLKGVSSANLMRRNRLGEAALTVYAVSKKLVRAPEHAALLPHLSLMRKANRFGRNRQASAPPPVPTPRV